MDSQKNGANLLGPAGMRLGPYRSNRFERRLWLTTHARRRALERRIPIEVLLDIVETGTQQERDAGHCWIWKVVEGREDNPLCVAALVADTVIIKTVMYYFEPEANRCM